MSATPRRKANPVRLAFLSLITMLIASSACSSQTGSTSSPGVVPSSPATEGSSALTPTATTSTTQATSRTTQENRTVTTIKITIGGETISGELNNSATAQDLAEQLPLDVTLSDFNGVEKVGELPRPLTMDGVPAGADPDINDIGYYRPSNGLVFYYGDVGYFNGIVRIGHLSASDMQLIQRQSGTFTISIHAD